LNKLPKKHLATYQARELEGELETIAKGGEDDEVQDADQALTDGQLEEELKTAEKGGKHDKVQDADQAPLDLLFGILRDWTYIAAGAPGPWTRHPETPLGKLVSDRCERPDPNKPVSNLLGSPRPAAEVWVAPGSSGCLPTLTIFENSHCIDPFAPCHHRDLPGESQVAGCNR